MSWFFISLLGTCFFAASNFIDKILINKYFKGGGVGALAIYSALIGFFVLPLPLFIDQNFFVVNLKEVGIMMTSGIVYLIGIIAYLYAMTKDDTSTVVPFFQIIPIFAYIMGYIFLKEEITTVQFIGMCIIIFASILLSLDLSANKLKFKAGVVVLMLVSSFFISLSNLLFKVGGIDSGFWVTSFWTYLGYAVLGIILFVFFGNYRIQFISSVKSNSIAILSINTVNEIVGITGKMLQNLATLLAPLALAIAVNGFQPAIVLVYGVLLTIFFPHLIKENISKKHIFFKILCIIVLTLGALMVA